MRKDQHPSREKWPQSGSWLKDCQLDTSHFLFHCERSCNVTNEFLTPRQLLFPQTPPLVKSGDSFQFMTLIVACVGGNDNQS